MPVFLLILSADQPLDEDAVSAALKEFKIKISKVKKARKLPF